MRKDEDAAILADGVQAVDRSLRRPLDALVAAGAVKIGEAGRGKVLGKRPPPIGYRCPDRGHRAGASARGSGRFQKNKKKTGAR